MRALLLALALTMATAAQAAGPAVSITHPWSRPAPAGGVGVGYITFTNPGSKPVTVSTISTTDAYSATMHRTVEQNGIVSMSPTLSLVIPPGKSVSFAPGGYHIMFHGLKKTLRAGDRVKTKILIGGKPTPVDFIVE